MVLHRDIKPDNLLTGMRTKEHIIYIIDFGLSKYYYDLRTGNHIRYRKVKDMIGTMRYASMNALLGVEQSRRDDLEGLGYMYIYLRTGKLPWLNENITDPEAIYNLTWKLKNFMNSRQLCENLPDEFSKYLDYCRHLAFEEEPDYAKLKKLFKDLYEREGYKDDNIFDWTIIKKPKIENISQVIESANKEIKEVKVEDKKVTDEEEKKVPKPTQPTVEESASKNPELASPKHKTERSGGKDN